MSASIIDVPAVTTDEGVDAPEVLVEIDARLWWDSGRTPAERVLAIRQPTSWSVTFGFGGPAEYTWTEIRVPIVEDVDGAPLPEQQQRHLERVAVDAAVRAAYGIAWAFVYPPEQYDEAIAAYPALRRREVLEVSVRVLS